MISVNPHIIYFPLTLLSASLLFIIVAIFNKQNGGIFKEVSKWNLFLGTVVLIITVILKKNGAVPFVHEYIIPIEKLDYILTGVFIFLSSWLIVKKRFVKGVDVKIFISTMSIAVILLIYTSIERNRMYSNHNESSITVNDISQNKGFRE
nr:hypothetical protein [uncultured Carboxylicivirga sp.]